MFTLSFWKTALESTVLAFLTAFSGAFAIQGATTLKGVEAAAIAGGMGALYAFTKQLGGVQAVSAILKVAPKAVPSIGHGK